LDRRATKQDERYWLCARRQKVGLVTCVMQDASLGRDQVALYKPCSATLQFLCFRCVEGSHRKSLGRAVAVCLIRVHKPSESETRRRRQGAQHTHRLQLYPFLLRIDGCLNGFLLFPASLSLSYRALCCSDPSPFLERTNPAIGLSCSQCIQVSSYRAVVVLAAYSADNVGSDERARCRGRGRTKEKKEITDG
jgi:hypothetical protein